MTATRGSATALRVAARDWAAVLASRQVALWLRLEAAAALVAGLIAYGRLGGDWIWLVPLLILPDLSMVGYVRSVTLGSVTYNVIHNWAVALAALGAGSWLGIGPLALAGAVLVTHIGGDRLMGYGLKYPTRFSDTHMQHI